MSNMFIKSDTGTHSLIKGQEGEFVSLDIKPSKDYIEILAKKPIKLNKSEMLELAAILLFLSNQDHIIIDDGARNCKTCVSLDNGKTCPYKRVCVSPTFQNWIGTR